MTDNQIIIGLLTLLTIAVGLLVAEIARLGNAIQPVLDSTLVRTATSF